MYMIVAFFGLATLWATFSKSWAIFSNLLVTLVRSPRKCVCKIIKISKKMTRINKFIRWFQQSSNYILTIYNLMTKLFSNRYQSKVFQYFCAYFKNMLKFFIM
jgi:hypothetical protein